MIRTIFIDRISDDVAQVNDAGEDVMARYRAGEVLTAIAAEYETSASAIKRFLDAAGVPRARTAGRPRAVDREALERRVYASNRAADKKCKARRSAERARDYVAGVLAEIYI